MAELRAAIAGLDDHQRERLGRGWRKTIEKKERTDGAIMRMSRQLAEEMKYHRFNIATDALIAAIAGLNDHQREILGRDWRRTMEKLDMKKPTILEGQTYFSGHAPPAPKKRSKPTKP